MKYRATAILRLPANTVLDLSAEQASARAHVLDKRGSKYITRDAVTFKAGEIVGLDKPEKSLLAVLEPVREKQT